MARTQKNMPEDPVGAFKRHAERIQELTERVGTPVRAYLDGRLPLLRSLSAAKRQIALAHVADYCAVLESTFANAGSEGHDKQVVWEAFKRYKLTPPPDFFNYLGRDDVVEIHDFDGIQLFRNLQFFRFCSYTIEDLFCRAWHDLYDHSGGSTDQILAVFEQIRTGKITGMYATNVPEHLITERFSDKKYLIKATVQYAAPLRNAQRVTVATVVIEKGQLLPHT